MLTQQQRLDLAELVHMAMRGRPPGSDDELHQAEQAAVHISDWFETRAKWVPAGVDTVTLAVDEVAVLTELAINARHALADIVAALRSTPTDQVLVELAAPKRTVGGRVVGE